MKQTRVLAMAVFVSLLFLSSFASADEPLSGELVIEGTGDSQELLRALGRRFEALYPNTNIVVQSL